MPRLKENDAHKSAAVLAAYDKLTPEEKQKIMDMDRRLETRKMKGLGRVLRLEVIAAIGAMMEGR